MEGEYMVEYFILQLLICAFEKQYFQQFENNIETNNNATNEQEIVNNETENTNVADNTTNTNVTPYVNVVESSNSDIPYTGVEDTLVYIIGVLLIAAAVLYIKFEKINKDVR